MVVKVPDNFADIISKGNVVIPCQCYFNARDNILTEVIKNSFNPFLQNSEQISQINLPKNSLENTQKLNRKDAQTETPVEQCCICEYFRDLEMNQNKKKLWNMQFNRWWGWNWQRKRNDFLSKLKMKSNKNIHSPVNSINDASKFNHICHQRQTFDEKLAKSSTSKESFVPEQRKISKNIPGFAEPKHAMPPLTTYGFKKPYISRRKKYKRKQKLYEGWVKEINSSESDGSVKSIKLKMQHPETSNSREYGNYLSVRLRKLNSDESVDYDYKYQYPRKLKSRLADSKYVSPISGKYYNINLPEISVPISERFDTEYLKPINVKDSSIIPRPRFDWIENFSLIKEEHSRLLMKINEILNSSKIIDKLDKNINTEPKMEFKNFGVDTSSLKNSMSENISCNLIHNSMNFSPNIFHKNEENFPKNKFMEHKSDYVFVPTNPFSSAVLKDERSKSVNLPCFLNRDNENLNKEETCFENTSFKSNFDFSSINNNVESVHLPTMTNSGEENVNKVENMEIDEPKCDLQFINNKLLSTTSLISNINCLCSALNVKEEKSKNSCVDVKDEENKVSCANVKECVNIKDEEKKISSVNIKEDMSERILMEVDYLNNLTLLYNR